MLVVVGCGCEIKIIVDFEAITENHLAMFGGDIIEFRHAITSRTV